MSEVKKEKERSYPKNKVNPFLKKDIKKVKMYIRKKRHTMNSAKNIEAVNSKTGELVDGIEFTTSQWRYTDTEKFTKVFLTDPSVFFRLTKQGIRLFFYFATKLPQKKDKVYFNLEEAKQFTEYSSDRSIYQGINDLMKNKIIAKGSSTFLYYINPSVFFNGDRTSIVEEFESQNFKKKVSDQIESDQVFGIEHTF